MRAARCGRRARSGAAVLLRDAAGVLVVVRLSLRCPARQQPFVLCCVRQSSSHLACDDTPVSCSCEILVDLAKPCSWVVGAGVIRILVLSAAFEFTDSWLSLCATFIGDISSNHPQQPRFWRCSANRFCHIKHNWRYNYLLPSQDGYALQQGRRQCGTS